MKLIVDTKRALFRVLGNDFKRIKVVQVTIFCEGLRVSHSAIVRVKKKLNSASSLCLVFLCKHEESELEYMSVYLDGLHNEKEK